jgi:hypothetical protein
MLTEKYFKEGIKFLSEHFNFKFEPERIEAIYLLIKDKIHDNNLYHEVIHLLCETEQELHKHTNISALILKYLEDLRLKQRHCQYQQPLQIEDKKQYWVDFEEFFNECCEVGMKNYGQKPSEKFCRAMWNKLTSKENRSLKDILQDTN